MKVLLYEYNDDGKTLSKKYVELYFASSSKNPTFVVELGEKRRRHTAIDISAKQISSLFFSHLIQKINT